MVSAPHLLKFPWSKTYWFSLIEQTCCTSYRFFHYVAFVISSVTVWTCEVISWRANIYCSVNYSSKKKKKHYRTLEKSNGFTNFVQVPLHYADRSFKLRKYCCCFNNSASFPERLFGIFLIGVYFFQVMF